MKLTELPDSTFSCEFFPPTTDAGVHNLLSRAKRLVGMGASFVSVTWGAGGTSADRSVELALKLRETLGPKIPIVLHLTCTNMSRSVLDSTLAKIADPASGIDNILALRGDRPRAEYQVESAFNWAVDLIKYIKKCYGDRFCLGVAGYPEGFTDSPTIIPDVNRDLEHLADKMEAGAEFIMTQLFYDPLKFVAYVNKIRDHPRLGSSVADMVFPGLMPLASYRTFVRSAELSHASVPIQILGKLKKLNTLNDDLVKKFGVELMTNIIEVLRANNITKFHFFTLNLEKSLTEILINSKLAIKQAAPESPNMPGSPNLRASDWDEFVNGRYTDPSSAAYGEMDGYGPIVHGSLGGKPNPRWGELTCEDDIANMFIRHVTNELPVFPFGADALSAETALIQEELIELNMKGKWTLSSQPAVHGVPSTDRIFGWGPPNGKIFQYAFLEFLCDSMAWIDLRMKLISNPKLAFYAASETGEVDTNVPKHDKNVITWGEWPETKKETTIIAYESFKAWRNETFSVLRNWQQLYEPNSASYNVLNKVSSSRVLVTVIFKDTKDEMGLWNLL